MLAIRNLSKSYRYADARQSVLEQLDFDMVASSSVALLGESGSGKSTLLHLIAGLDHADQGEIHFDGHAIHAARESELAALRRSRLSLVFQQFHLISTLTVLDNIRFQAALCRRLDPAYESELIERLGLGDQTGKYPQQLSRGQQQRVAIARALLHKPLLVLADEPTGNLDESSSIEVMGLFSELVKRAGSSLLMVTHSRSMADFLDRRVYLHNGKLTESE
ncbi:MAG: ABC transporter ATP-binding protein [Gammaproteobacteria bacterium]|jgi:putative ABC transport system ATP-binding protein|nr:ABC transporter ATP-binding protein [Gammaproteobacteria bacterium]